MYRAFIAGLALLAGMALQMKSPQACDHAAPPEGMRWVCASGNPCDCHLETNTSEGHIEDGTSKPYQPGAASSHLDCRITFFAIPTYPESARQGRKQGVVSASLVLNADGTVEQVRIQSGDPQLANAAQSAFRQWRFTPGGRYENIPVSVKFVLSDNSTGLVTGMSLLDAVVSAKPAR
jgi:TonB family protein